MNSKEALMSVKHRILFPMAIAILAATASLAEVRTDYDRTAEFSCYKTYSWGNVHTQNPLGGDRIKAAVASTGFGDGSPTSTTTEETYKAGTPVVDLFDTNTRKLIWLGSAYALRQI